MDYHAIRMLGPFVMETGPIPTFDPSYERRIKYNPSDEKMYYASSTRWIQLSEKYGDIPQNTIMLFLSDSSVLGFQILTDIDDQVVYITKGSAAGGEAGGTDKIGSTWTQGDHDHTLTPHSHTLGTHTHTFSTTTQTENNTTVFNESGGGDAAWIDHGHGLSGTTNSSGGTTGSNVSGTTGLSGTSGSWRPKGVNFTRQQRI